MTRWLPALMAGMGALALAACMDRALVPVKYDSAVTRMSEKSGSLQTLPDRNTRILIYCNNNFANAEGPFPAKIARASLNLSTYIALYSYGYRNYLRARAAYRHQDFRATILEMTEVE